MKKWYLLFAVFMLVKTVSAQVLLEDKEGDKIVNNNILVNPQVSRLSLIKLNTGDQSLGFSYFTSSALHDPAKYAVQEFGLKASPTAGYAAVFRNGQFSPGIKANYGFTLVNPFNRATTSKTVDWLSVDLGYNYDKYLLYQPTSAFADQLYNKISQTYFATLSYNFLLNSKYIINLKTGYSRRNNYADLSSVEVKDITTINNGNTQRQVQSSSTASQGNYVEYNAFPQIVSFTRATQTDDPSSENASKLRLGYTLFVKNQFSSYLNKTDAGVIFFLTKQDKSGIRNPVLGFIIQAVNLFDTQHLDNGLQNRIRVGFTTNFSL
ncbi:hypothetical protein [uncultured Mucilaginibacter sp.]|uniref:hypothetical protein n=1 Tax=uncultured Mucilaginibacter sp. TaxID=797541 RepID=UPI002635A2E2|nr:hypothetical protein [uncultured Mucilaginibacter sp.]